MKNPALESLERIKLMMNYDSKKTLSENKLIIESDEQLINTIVNDLAASTNPRSFGTNMGEMRRAFDNIAKLKSGKSLISVNQGIAGKLIGSDGYKNIAELLIGELENDNLEDLKKFINILNKVPGIRASQDWYNKDEKQKVRISYVGEEPKPDNSAQIPSWAACIAKYFTIKKVDENTVRTLKEKYYEWTRKANSLGVYSLQFFWGDKTGPKGSGSWSCTDYGCLFITIDGYGTWDCKTKKWIEDSEQKETDIEDAPKDSPKQETERKQAIEICEIVCKGKTLRRGDTGLVVGRVQEALKYCGMTLEKGVDNKFGKDTKKAVIEFQTKHGLNPDGVVGEKTIKKLLDLPCMEQNCDCKETKLRTDKNQKTDNQQGEYGPSEI